MTVTLDGVPYFNNDPCFNPDVYQNNDLSHDG